MKRTVQKRSQHKIQRSRILCIFVISVFFVAGAIFFWSCQGDKNTLQEVSVKHRLQWWLSAINWDDNRTRETGEGIRVAILDSGVDISHPDIKNKIEREYRVPKLSLPKNRKNKKRTDNILHGTAVAGIIAGYPASAKGVYGVAPEATIISVDITDQKNGTVETGNLVAGIQYAIEQQVDIINISAGVKQPSEELYQVVRCAYERGIVVVASAGNYMKDDLLYPAKYNEVIAAGAVSREKNILSPKGNIQKKVIYLPGENIATIGKDHGYVGMNGTSAAAPILTGIITLMKEKHSKLTNKEIIKYFNSYSHTEIDVRKCIELK